MNHCKELAITWTLVQKMYQLYYKAGSQQYATDTEKQINGTQKQVQK